MRLQEENPMENSLPNRQKCGMIVKTRNTFHLEETMRAVITVIGKDMVGILASISSACAEHNANITEVTQTIMQDLFAMIMLADISSINCEFHVLVDHMKALGDKMGLSVHVMHETIFDSMHRI